MTRGELVGALGSVLGGIIGAAGAALAVYLTLGGERRDERKRIAGAVRREVSAFMRAAVVDLNICETILTRQVNMPVAHFPLAMGMPKPTIYPAIADRIGRLQAPHRLVSFFMRIAEVQTMAAVIGVQPQDAHPIVTPEDARLVVAVLTDVLRFGEWIITEKKPEPGIDAAAQAALLKDVSEALERAETRK